MLNAAGFTEIDGEVLGRWDWFVRAALELRDRLLKRRARVRHHRRLNDSINDQEAALADRVRLVLFLNDTDIHPCLIHHECAATSSHLRY